jgi:hypothetical protein
VGVGVCAFPEKGRHGALVAEEAIKDGERGFHCRQAPLAKRILAYQEDY